ncbi:MAG TPA: hypothetical protein VF345_06075 [Chthoniobacterales bacterium]
MTQAAFSVDARSVDTFQGTVMAKFALDTLHAKKVAILTDVKSGYSIIKGEHIVFWRCAVRLTGG